MQAGCYTLDLYCDKTEEHPLYPFIDKDPSEHGHRQFPMQFTAEKGGQCRRAARKAGWRLGRFGKPDLCPLCNPRNVKKKPG